MKRNILIIFIIVLSFIVLKSDIYASKVSEYELLTYIDADDHGFGKLKKSFYNEQASDSDDPEKKNTHNYLPGDKWSAQTGSFFIMGIWKEVLGGNLAFCLDPGKGVAQNYNPVQRKNDFFSNLNFDEKVYAAIYKSDFTKIGIASDDGTKIDNYGDYIIKQMIFWAYEADKNDHPIFSFEQQGGYLKFNSNGSGSDDDYDDVLYYNEPEGKVYTYRLLSDDIISALLHYYRDSDGDKVYSNIIDYLDPKKTNNNSFSGNKKRLFNHIIEEIQNSYNKLRSDNNTVDITKYEPIDEHPERYQRFVSVYVPPDPEINVNKYYATAVSLDDGKSISSVESSFSNMNGSNVSKSRPGYSEYEYQGYMIYRSRDGYGNSPRTVIEQSSITEKLVASDTCTLNYSTSLEYNVIVFIYKVQPKYTVTYNYYYKSASESGSEYHYIRSGTIGDLRKGAKVTNSIPKTCDSTYNTTLYNTYSISTTVSNLSTAGDYINFDMPASDVTVNIYYQYGQVTIRKYRRNNDGTDTPVDSPETKDLTSDQIIGIPSNIDYEGGNYGYFIYEQNSSKEYLPTPGNRTIPKGKNNVTINLYYARRILDHRHVLKVGPSYGGVLETRRN